VKGSRSEHVCGDPKLGPEKDRAYGRRIAEAALEAVETVVAEPVLFDPAELRQKGAAIAT
jgi:hypothetical protein